MNARLYTVVDLWRPKQTGMMLQVRRSEGLEGERKEKKLITPYKLDAHEKTHVRAPRQSRWAFAELAHPWYQILHYPI